MNNRDVRKWYIDAVSRIKDNIEPSLTPRERAFEAYKRRIDIRYEARERMADFETRDGLDIKQPNHNPDEFEKYVLGKMKEKGLTREETYLYLVDSATRTNSNVNKELRLGK